MIFPLPPFKSVCFQREGNLLLFLIGKSKVSESCHPFGITERDDYGSVFLHVCPALSNSLRPHGLYPVRLLCPVDFSGSNIGVGCHFLLWGSASPRDRTQVSCISCTGRLFLYHCASWETHNNFLGQLKFWLTKFSLIHNYSFQLP